VSPFSRGKTTPEGRAVAGPGLILEHAAVLFYDASGNRQAEAGAGFLRAEEWVE